MMTSKFEYDIDKKYVIWGANEKALKVFELLISNGCNVYAFAEHNEKLWDHEFNGKSILNFNELYELNSVDTIFIITVPNVSDTRELLKYAGFRNVFVYHEDMEIYKEFMEECKDGRFKDVISKCYIAVVYGTVASGCVAARNTDYIKNWRKLFESYNIFEDDLSKTVFLNLIEYKYTSNRELLQEIFDKDEEQYYFKRLSFSSEEVFIDGGACQGDSIFAFMEKMNNKFHKIYAFEPNRIYYNAVKTLFRKNENITVFNSGIYSDNTKLYFKEHRHGSRFVEDKMGIEVCVSALDKTIPEEEKVTFIKFDIEGSELDGLKGAENIIKRNKPKLAICVYHKLEDFYTIPLYIKELEPNYSLYLRHYHDKHSWETVCYAVIE